MTENKRFLIDDAGELIDLNNHKFIDYGDECCKLLNELSDENEQLKQGLNDDLELIGQLQEENKQLKSTIAQLINKIDFLERVIDGDLE